MCGGSSLRPSAQLPEAPTPPTQSTDSTTAARDRKRRAGGGATGTILTGSSGVTGQANTQQKTLLGA